MQTRHRPDKGWPATLANQHALTKISMRGILKSCATALMLMCMGGNVWAATANSAGCAKSEDMFAVRVAAVQQRLMVAAFSCRAFLVQE